ncbi:MAG: hypothetical protein KGO99_02140 [Actinomycetales bacterium]|nr:hypothetical protein [Actinomycetales bacterium]
MLIQLAVQLEAQLASDSASAPVPALVWLIIPALALVGGLAYAYWVTKLKSKYDNQVNRSVGRFQKFQDSFNDSRNNSNHDNSQNSNQ